MLMPHIEVRDVQYVGAAGALVLIALAVSLDAQVIKKVMGLSIIAVLVVLLANRSIVIVDRDTNIKQSDVAPDTTKRQLRGDMYQVRRTMDHTNLTAILHPDVSAHIRRMHKLYGKSNKGTVDIIASDIEHFISTYSQTLMLKQTQGSAARPLYEQLHDMRNSIINSMVSLLYAKPHAHTSRTVMLNIINSFKRHSMRCLQILHNKFGQHDLQVDAPIAPRSFDPIRIHDPFSVHI